MNGMYKLRTYRVYVHNTFIDKTIIHVVVYTSVIFRAQKRFTQVCLFASLQVILLLPNIHTIGL